MALNSNWRTEAGLEKTAAALEEARTAEILGVKLIAIVDIGRLYTQGRLNSLTTKQKVYAVHVDDAWGRKHRAPLQPPYYVYVVAVTEIDAYKKFVTGEGSVYLTESLARSSMHGYGSGNYGGGSSHGDFT